MVHAGDTLWNGGHRAYPGNLDTRQLVYRVERRNGLASADIHPGQTLACPSCLSSAGGVRAGGGAERPRNGLYSQRCRLKKA